DRLLPAPATGPRGLRARRPQPRARPRHQRLRTRLSHPGGGEGRAAAPRVGGRHRHHRRGSRRALDAAPRGRRRASGSGLNALFGPAGVSLPHWTAVLAPGTMRPVSPVLVAAALGLLLAAPPPHPGADDARLEAMLSSVKGRSLDARLLGLGEQLIG